MKWFIYGEQGHLKRHYPETTKYMAVPTNLNVVNEGDAACNNLIEGMISIQGTSAIFLFHFGCTHSFILYSIVRKLNLTGMS